MKHPSEEFHHSDFETPARGHQKFNAEKDTSTHFFVWVTFKFNFWLSIYILGKAVYIFKFVSFLQNNALLWYRARDCQREQTDKQISCNIRRLLNWKRN